MSAPKPEPFRIAVPQETLDDLKARLTRARLPDEAPEAPWTYGTSVSYMRDLVAYWRDAYDWRKHEAELNAFPQFKVEIDGIGVHFIHVQGKGPNPKPLLLSHGWPGSIVEFAAIIPMLTDPAAFGGDPADAFTVVAPSLPGYGFSFREGQKRVGLAGIGDMFARLMRDVLGYQKFCAQGGDWGSFVTSRIGSAYPESVYGIHINLLALPRDRKGVSEPTTEEKAYFAELEHFLMEETGYQWIQGTKPQTLSYGLTDSPVGLAAWIVEKFRAWSDCGGDVENAISRDAMLTNITIYWATGAINSSFWPYYDRRHGPWPFKLGEKIKAPMGYAQFPREIIRPPRSLAERLYDVRRWSVMDKGGHFAALEQPEALA
ncbi:MAG: epoxide hydrolase, partial [Hyphomicrobiales bacterium]|nr:epoxide hydrolase [Hyphomicrobiales bacterium]